MKDEAYLLDTDVIIEYLQKKPYAVELMEQLMEDTALAISVITILELCAGWNTAQEKRYLPLITDIFDQKEVTTDIAKLAGRYLYHWKTKGRLLTPTHCLIAATASTYDLPLITGNTKHYPMKDIQVLPPSKV